MVLFKRFMWIVASRLLAAILQAVTLILIASDAGPSKFGLLSAFMGVVVIIQVISDCGIAPYLTRLRAQIPDSKKVGTALKVHGVLGLLACLMLLGAALMFAYVGNQSWWFLVLLAIAGYLERQSDVRLTLAVADGDVWKNAFNLTLRRVITFLLVIAGLLTKMEPVLVFGAGSFLGSLVSFLLSKRLVSFQHHSGMLGWSHFRGVFAESGHFWMNSIGVQLRNLDVLLIVTLATPTIAGYYGAIARSLNPLMMISTSLAAVLLPIASQSNGKLGKSLSVPIAVVFGLVVSLFLTMAFYAEKIVLILFGPQFLPASTGFQVVLIGLIFASLSALLSSFLQARGYAQSVGRVSIFTSIVSLSGITCGVILNGVSGAAVGLASAYVIQSLCLLAAILRFVNNRTSD